MIGRIAVCCIFIIGFLSNPVSAKEKGTETLTAFFDNLKTLSADFEQKVENAQLSSTEQASGKLWIERPGKFRWDYISPYEQQIVSDGKKLWMHDKDLEQVTVREIGESMGNTPAVLLSDSKPITDTFKINDIGFKGRLHWVELLPKDPEASFTKILLGFDGSVFSEMLLEDNLGQITRLGFTNLNEISK
ncbi:MAG: outer membrane lipoprotein chaperone LolA [Gammaproteobacteria bacterium]|nr:outer membrane lipoprotein chaperone LolA [Gammaproteobacteria bacterium]